MNTLDYNITKFITPIKNLNLKLTSVKPLIVLHSDLAYKY